MRLLKMFIVNRKDIIFLLFLFIIVLSVYANSLRNNFMMDDWGLILQDTTVHNIRFMLYQFIPDRKISFGLENNAPSHYYRPFAHILPMIEWMLFGKNVFGYHLINLLLFYFSLIAIFYLINTLFVDKWLAMITSLLYAVHPLNGLFVNYITANVYAFQLIVLSVGFILFWRVVDKGKPKFFVILSVFFYILALLCHESSFAFPFYLIVTTFILKGRIEKKHIKIILPYIVISIFYFIFRIKYASLATNLFDKIKNSGIGILPLICSNIKLFFLYISQFLFFNGITLQRCIMPVVSSYSLWLILFFIFIGVFFYWSYRRREKVIVWGISTLLLGFVPVVFGSVFELHCGILFEPHWVFFPSIGIFSIVAFCILIIRERAGRILFWIVVSIITLNALLFSRTMNKLWANEIVYCKYWFSFSPTQRSILFYLASAYDRKGEYDKAKLTYLKAIENRFTDWQIYVNLSIMEQNKGNFSQANKYLLKAYKLFPCSAVINNNLGVLYKNLKREKEAVRFFKKAISYNPYVIEPYLNLALIYEQSKDYLKAVELYRRVLYIVPNTQEALIGEINSLIALRDIKTLNTEIQRLLDNNYPTNIYLNIAIRLIRQGYDKIALRVFHKILTLDPLNVDVYIELAKYFANVDNFDMAIKICKAGLIISPDNKEIKDIVIKVKKLKSNGF